MEGGSTGSGERTGTRRTTPNTTLREAELGKQNQNFHSSAGPQATVRSQIIAKLHGNGINLSLPLRGAEGLNRWFKWNLIFKQLSAGVGRDFVLGGNRYPLLLTTVLLEDVQPGVEGSDREKAAAMKWTQSTSRSVFWVCLCGFIAMGNNL